MVQNLGPVTDGQPAIDVNGGIFSRALLDGLKGQADSDQNGIVDVTELHSYIYNSVVIQAEFLGHEQVPGQLPILVNGGQFVHFYRGSDVP